MQLETLVYVIFALLLIYEAMPSEGKSNRRRGRKHKKHNKRTEEEEVVTDPCLSSKRLKGSVQKRWIKTFGLLNKDTKELLDDIGCKFDPTDCILPEIATYVPSVYPMKASCAREYINNVVSGLKRFYLTFSGLKSDIDRLQTTLVIKSDDPIGKLTNTVMNDIASTIKKFGGGRVSEPASDVLATLSVASSTDVYTLYVNTLKDFKLFVNNVISLVKLR